MPSIQLESANLDEVCTRSFAYPGLDSGSSIQGNNCGRTNGFARPPSPPLALGPGQILGFAIPVRLCGASSKIGSSIPLPFTGISHFAPIPAILRAEGPCSWQTFHMRGDKDIVLGKPLHIAGLWDCVR